MLADEAGRDEAQLLVERQPFGRRVQHQRARLESAISAVIRARPMPLPCWSGATRTRPMVPTSRPKLQRRPTPTRVACGVDGDGAGAEREQLRAILQPMRPRHLLSQPVHRRKIAGMHRPQRRLGAGGAHFQIVVHDVRTTYRAMQRRRRVVDGGVDAAAG